MHVNTDHTSPNLSSRVAARVNMLVLHATVGELDATLSWLCDTQSGVSCHYVINRNGDVYQLVECHNAAWHAGQASWNGMMANAIQRQSIGIELVNKNTGIDPYPREQQNALTELAHCLIHAYSIPMMNVVRHVDISPGRKTDPAGFPWAKWRAELLTLL